MTTVCILAAGLGTRVTKYGGALHKALLPLGNRAAISRIIDEFPETARIVVAVGHRAEQIRDYLALAHPDRDIRFVAVDRFAGPGAGPGYSLWCCREQLAEPFVFTACDTLVPDPLPPLPSGNWIGVHPVDDPARWCTVGRGADGRVDALHYKTPAGSHEGFVGIAGVADPARFFAALDSARRNGGEVQVDAGLEALIPSGLDAVPLPWIDVGADDHYDRAVALHDRNYTFAGKTNDATYRHGDAVIKFFADAGEARRKFARGAANRGCFADVRRRLGNFLSYGFVAGVPLSERLDAGGLESLLAWMSRNFWVDAPVDRAEFVAACRAFYDDKTRQRLSRYLAMPHLSANPEAARLRLNGRDTRPVAAALDAIGEAFWQGGLASTYPGDFHVDNVIARDDGGFTLIDWRDSFGEMTDVGDRYYDLAKLFHTLDLSVETMARGGYRIAAEPGGLRLDHDDTPALAAARGAFWRFAAENRLDSNRIRILNGLIFINMAPLYAPPMADYLYHLGRLRLEEALALQAQSEEA